MMATYSPRVDLDVAAGDRVDFLVAHDVGLPQIVGADDDAFALQFVAAIDLLFQYLWHDVLPARINPPLPGP